MAKVAIIGSINMDYTTYVDEFVKPGNTISGNKRLISPGGKGANQAMACFKAGADCVFIGAIGDDSDGKNIVEIYDASNLPTSIEKVDSETGNATIIVNKNAENEIIVVSGANNELSFDHIKKSITDDVSFIVIQNEINKEITLKIIEEYKDRTIIYNPSPVVDIDVNYLKNISYLIVNEHELEYYAKGLSIDKKVKYLLSLGVKNVLVTLGKKGSKFINKEKEIFVPALVVNAIDTVCAGDTYLGYFVAMISKNVDIKEAMEIASKASSIAVTRKGAMSSIPELYEVK